MADFIAIEWPATDDGPADHVEWVNRDLISEVLVRRSTRWTWKDGTPLYEVLANRPVGGKAVFTGRVTLEDARKFAQGICTDPAGSRVPHPPQAPEDGCLEIESAF